ncbi:unnamed protein product [Cladocopium goreaui]|uniref:C2 domain-containing protein n=1 Tax=Cladocopium goreaui TaxID=2562237 RepID=A0A9P1BVC7_9DINO|nr:unnamed protein product [Cladocopium goreaui]
MGANCASNGQACAQGGSQQSPRTPKGEEDDVSRLTMWEQDVEAVKEEAAKRQQRREQEAAARQARIEAVEMAAEEGRGGKEVSGATKTKTKTLDRTECHAECPAECPEAPASKNGAPVADVEMPKAEERTKEPAQEPPAPPALPSPTLASPTLPSPTLLDSAKPQAVDGNVQKEIEEVRKTVADLPQPTETCNLRTLSLVRYLLEVKIVSAKNVPAEEKQQFAVGLARCDNAVKFRTKTAATREKAVWNQASKLQIAHGDFLTFRVQDKDSEDPMAFIARTNLDFDRMLPAGFEDELDLEDTSGNKVAGSVLKVRVRVHGARVATGQE